MRLTPTRSLATLLFATTLASSPGPDRLVFGPEEGTVLVKTVTVEGDLELDEIHVVLDGSDVSEMLGGIELSLLTRLDLEVTDVYGPVEEGRTLSLERTYDRAESLTEVSLDGPMGSEAPPAVVMESDLVGSTIVFEWDAEDEEYLASWAEGSGGDDAVLEGLQQSIELAFLLPDGEVSEGDDWEVPVEAFTELLMPGGELSFGDDDLDVARILDGIEGELSSCWEGVLCGTATCTFTGVREEDGRRLGEVAYELDLASTLDLSETLSRLVENAGGPEGGFAPEFDVVDLELELRVEGTLLWDLEAGHARALASRTSGTVTLDLGMVMESMGEASSLELSAELSGRMDQDLTFE